MAWVASLSVQQTGLARCRYVTASVYQMLRGAEILFSAIFAVTFLKRPLNRLHYGGIAGCLAGICLVGASSLLSPASGGSSQAGMVLLGMALIVIAQVGAPPGKLCAAVPRRRPLLPMRWQPIELLSRWSSYVLVATGLDLCAAASSWGWHACLGCRAASADAPHTFCACRQAGLCRDVQAKPWLKTFSCCAGCASCPGDHGGLCHEPCGPSPAAGGRL